MSARPNVKPLMHWMIYRHYTVRITERTTDRVAGIMTTPAGQAAFSYDPIARIVHLPDKNIAINEYGWEIET
jgi:hypothetical protein